MKELSNNCSFHSCDEVCNSPRYLRQTEVPRCICLPVVDYELNDTERRKFNEITSVPAPSFGNRYQESYAIQEVDNNKCNPPDVAAMRLNTDIRSENNYYPSYADFIKKQPDILQSTYCGNGTSPVYADSVDSTCNYLPNSYCIRGNNIEESRRKSHSLPKSFQRNDKLNKDFKLSNK